MAKKSSREEMMKSLRQRAEAMVSRPPDAAPSADDQPAEPTRPDETAPAPEQAAPPAPENGLGAHFGIEALDRATAGQAVQRIAVRSISPDVRPDMRQPRLLPLPEALLHAGEPAPGYAEVVAALRELGHSLREQQIQPLVVYPGHSDAYPEARYLILVGHRRWTAARLVGLAELEAVVVEPPTPAERLRLQYAENEERADFSDMERAWAITQMKHMLDDAPWEQVEERIQMSRGRRQELLRLLAFNTAQQEQCARLRLRETQLRPLHSAIRAGDLDNVQVDAILARLAALSQQKHGQQPDQQTAALDGPTIARLVAQARRRSSAQPQTTPRWLPSLLEQCERTTRGMQRAQKRLDELNEADATTLRERAQALRARLDEVEAALAPPPDAV
jgi:ParB/RepB/Spo0J family partition protein